MLKLKYQKNVPLDVEITLPGSKYLANRLLILAALSETGSTLYNMPKNDDIMTSIEGLSLLGATFQWSDHTLKCSGINWHNLATDLQINSSHSGSFSRFVLPLLALSEQSIDIGGSPKMNTRPMAELFRVLEKLGAVITSKSLTSKSIDQQSSAMTLPVSVKGPITGGKVLMSGETSSQYISALLMSAAKLEGGLVITLSAEPVSKPYLEMTIDLLKAFNVQVQASLDLREFTIKGPQQYQGVEYQLESDPSSASYFLAAAAITAGHICITNFYPERSLQGEAKFAEVLVMMGCKIWQDEQGYHCQGPKMLTAVNVDMCDMPDVVQTLASVAVFANGTTTISNIATLAFKESNRIEDTATELRKLGIQIDTTADSLVIHGGQVTQSDDSLVFETYDDHRMAMSLGLLSLKLMAIKINEHNVVAKSFPNYWKFLQQLGVQLS